MWRREEFLRVCDGLVSVLLALRKRPLIRLVCKGWLYSHEHCTSSYDPSSGTTNTVAMLQCSVAKMHDLFSGITQTMQYIGSPYGQIQGEGRVTVMRDEEGQEVMEEGGNERSFEGMC